MGFIWIVLAVAFGVALFSFGARLVGGGGGRRKAILGEERNEGVPHRNLGANINPSQLGNEADLWPDRTGPRTRRELGARKATDVTFVGDRVEQKKMNQQEAAVAKGGTQGVGRDAQPFAGEGDGVRSTAKLNQARGAQEGAVRPVNEGNTYGTVQSDPTHPVMKPGIRREVQPGPHEHGPGTHAGADLAPEDDAGEDRPANRTTAPDAPPTQWHPREHGVPGDHYREGHHRSATAPERRSDATDPYAHAPVPGPNHIIPDTGNELPPDVRP